MAAFIESTRFLASLLDYDVEVPVAALLKAAAVSNEVTMMMLLSRQRDFLDRRRDEGLREALVESAM
jgi:hypothetical protein